MLTPIKTMQTPVLTILFFISKPYDISFSKSFETNVYLQEDSYSAKNLENRILYFKFLYCKILRLLLVTNSCNTNFQHLFGVEIHINM